MNIIDAMRDDNLFRPFFRDLSSWAAWAVALKALFGLPIEDPGEVESFRRHTGREVPPSRQVREGWFVVGRRGGKSRIAALVAVFLACFRDHSEVLSPGERGTVAVIASDRRQARTVFRYITAFLEGVPMLKGLIWKRTAEAIELKNGIVLEVHTCSFRSVRGYTVVAAVFDEVAYWRSDESTNPDVEIANSVRPAMATVPGALLLGISSPYSRRGLLWEMHRAYYDREDEEILVWQADTRSMNPTVGAAFIARAYEEDEAVAAAEYGAEFRRDLEVFISRESIASVVAIGRSELPPIAGNDYFAFVDPSGGAADSFTMAIGHEIGRGQRVLDLLRERKPPFSPDQVVQEFAETLKRYGCTTVCGDRYAGEWPRERFAVHGITYEASEKTKSEMYLELLPAINSGRVELLDNERLISQLIRLERRTTRSGKDSVDHAPGGHDDLANAAAGAIVYSQPVPKHPKVTQEFAEYDFNPLNPVPDPWGR